MVLDVNVDEQRTLEVVTIIVSGTQLLCTVATHVWVVDMVARQEEPGSKSLIKPSIGCLAT
jgi:hypothetical protein